MSVGLNFELAYATPGITAAIQTTENILWWGRFEQLRLMGAVIDGAAADSACSPTDLLRAGLLLGQITSTKKLKQWDPTQTDGTENIYGVLMLDQKMNSNTVGTDRFVGPILVGGPIKMSALFRAGQTSNGPGTITSDPYYRVARAQMLAGGRFHFDDDIGLPKPSGFATVRSLADRHATAYTLLAKDNNTLWTNTGCSAQYALTLPTISNPMLASDFIGFKIGVMVTAAYPIRVLGGNSLMVVNGGATESEFTLNGTPGSYAEIHAVFDKTNAKWLVTLCPAAVASYNAITAGTTQTQAAGTTLGLGINKVTTGNANDAVVLPPGYNGGTAATVAKGTRVVVTNLSNATLQVFPPKGGKISGGSVDASTTVAANGGSGTKTTVFVCTVGGIASEWWTESGSVTGTA